MTSEIILRKVAGNDDVKWCPGCLHNVETDDTAWRAFWGDGDPTAPLCTVCIEKLDTRVLVALEVLNLQLHRADNDDVRRHNNDQMRRAEEEGLPF